MSLGFPGGRRPPPPWTTKSFRTHLAVLVVLLSVASVVVFEVIPKRTGTWPVGAPPPAPPAPRMEYLNPAAPRPVLSDGVLDKAKDGDPIDAGGEAYDRLVHDLSRMDPAELAKGARTVPYEEYGTRARDLRGRTVRIQALYLESTPLRPEGRPGGAEWIHRTYLVDPSGEQGYVVDLLDPPPALERRSLVVTDAIFLRTAAYEARKGTVHVPQLVGRSLRVLREGRATASTEYGVILVGTALTVVLFAVWMTMRLGRDPGKPRGFAGRGGRGLPVVPPGPGSPKV